MSEASGKVILTMFINGISHMFLPAIGIIAYSKATGLVENIRSSMNALLAVIGVIAILSFALHYISFTMVQSNVCGKVFQSGHLVSLAGYAILFPIVFVAAAWKIDFLSNIVRDFIPSEMIETPIGESIVLAFFGFFAGLYSMAALSWYATACPLPDAGPTVKEKV